MARRRVVDPAFFMDDDLASLSAHARLLYIGLWGLADDHHATLPNKPAWIKAQVLPYEEVNTHDLLSELSMSNHIVLFLGDDGKEYWYIPTFFDTQTISRPSRSKYPAFEQSKVIRSQSTRVLLNEDSQNTHSQVKLSKVSQVKLNGKNSEDTSSAASPEISQKQDSHDIEESSRAIAREPVQEDVAPPPAASTRVMGVDMSHVFEKKKGGITKKWQDKAFRHAEYLGISLKDESLKKRWLRFYKDHYCNKVESIVSYLVDYTPFKALDDDESRIKYFFSVFSNKSL